jgi:hypothetical protein
MSRHFAGARHRPSPRHQRWLYLTSTLLFFTGMGWLVSHYALRQVTALGLTPHPSEVWWLRLHGAAVVGFLIVFGALLPNHVVHNWRRRLHRNSGLFLLVSVGLLSLSGYGLYYLVSDDARALVSVIHWAVGIAAGLGFAVHIVLAQRRNHQRHST